jgi:hypothetical protein
MNIGRYAPSAQFTGIALSVLLSAGLVYGAERYTHPPVATAQIQSDQNTAQTSDSSNWEAALYASQAANASSSLVAPSPNMVNQFLAAAKSPNLTDTVARTILVNLSNAKSQGLGDDIPTQDQIISTAASQVASAQPQISNYAYADLKIVASSKNTLHTYGNGVMSALIAEPQASEQATLLAIDKIVEGGDKSQTATLATIGAAYKAIAINLAAVPVPQTLAPLQLQAINNFLALSATYENMQAISSDAVRGLAGLQAYENLMGANALVFTNIAQSLNKDGILFTKDEPGSAWGTLLATPAVSGSQ